MWSHIANIGQRLVVLNNRAPQLYATKFKSLTNHYHIAFFSQASTSNINAIPIFTAILYYVLITMCTTIKD